jgi:hypothetical protein
MMTNPQAILVSLGFFLLTATHSGCKSKQSGISDSVPLRNGNDAALKAFVSSVERPTVTLETSPLFSFILDEVIEPFWVLQGHAIHRFKSFEFTDADEIRALFDQKTHTGIVPLNNRLCSHQGYSVYHGQGVFFAPPDIDSHKFLRWTQISIAAAPAHAVTFNRLEIESEFVHDVGANLWKHCRPAWTVLTPAIADTNRGGSAEVAEWVRSTLTQDQMQVIAVSLTEINGAWDSVSDQWKIQIIDTFTATRL